MRPALDAATWIKSTAANLALRDPAPLPPCKSLNAVLIFSPPQIDCVDPAVSSQKPRR
jgi:hypothetical protein